MLPGLARDTIKGAFIIHAGLNDTTSVLLEVGNTCNSVSFFLKASARATIGLELDPNQWILSLAMLAKDFTSNDAIPLNLDAVSMNSFSPCTHAFACNIGMPPAETNRLFRAFDNTATMNYAFVFSPPSDCPSNWKLIVTVGSIRSRDGRSFDGYLYKRNGAVPSHVSGGVFSALELAEVAEPAFQADLQHLAEGTLKESIVMNLRSWINRPRVTRRTSQINVI